jgi:hypothetical protein
MVQYREELVLNVTVFVLAVFRGEYIEELTMNVKFLMCGFGKKNVESN